MLHLLQLFSRMIILKFFQHMMKGQLLYMACGMAVESGEPVALSCTQATASRNYLSGLTEAYYRKIPVSGDYIHTALGENWPELSTGHRP